MVDVVSLSQPGALEAHIRERLDRFASRYVGLAVGMSVGAPRAVVGFGSAGGEDPRPPDGGTSFQIGSVTKLFTALILADAVDRGEVALDQPVDTIMPGTATHPKGRPYTLEDLATHTSGLPRLPHGLAWQALRHRDDPYAGFTTTNLVETLAREPERPPGGRPRYSNLGYGVLGEALARVTGHTYGELVTTRIAEPLGLHATGVGGAVESGAPAAAGPRAAAVGPRTAVGHTRRGKPVVDWQLPALAGAGALRSTADDLLVFLRAHLEPEASPLPAAIAMVLSPRRSAGRLLRIGLGWQVLDNKDGSSWWWHNGGTGGFFGFVGLDPGTGAAVVVLANSARSVDRLGAALLQPIGTSARR